MHIYRPVKCGGIIYIEQWAEVTNFKQKIDVNFIYLGRMSLSECHQIIKDILSATKYCLSLRRVLCVAFLNKLGMLLF